MGEKDISSQEWNSLMSLYYRELMRGSREPSMSPRRGVALDQDLPRERYQDWRKEALGSVAERKEEEELERRYKVSQRHRPKQSELEPRSLPRQGFQPSPAHSPSQTPITENDSGLGEDNSTEGKRNRNGGFGQKMPLKNGVKNPQNGRMNFSAREIECMGEREDSTCMAPYDQAAFQEQDSRTELWKTDYDESPNFHKRAFSSTAVPEGVKPADLQQSDRTVRNDGQRRSIEQAMQGDSTIRNDGQCVNAERAPVAERILGDPGNARQRRSFEKVSGETAERNDAHWRSSERTSRYERSPVGFVSNGQRNTERLTPDRNPAGCVDIENQRNGQNVCTCNREECGERRSVEMNSREDHWEQTNGGFRMPPILEPVDRFNNGGRIHEWNAGEPCDLDVFTRSAGICDDFKHYEDRCAHSESKDRGARGCESLRTRIPPPDKAPVFQRRFEEERMHSSFPTSCRHGPLNIGGTNGGMRCFEKAEFPYRNIEHQLNQWNPRSNGPCQCGNQSSLQSLYRIVSLQSRQMALLEKQVSHLIDFLSSHDLGLPKHSSDAATMTSCVERIECSTCTSPKRNTSTQAQSSPQSKQSPSTSQSRPEQHSPLRDEDDKERDVSLSQLQEVVVETIDEPSPPTSLHIDVPDYTESSETEESDTTEDDDPPIGWTFYNNVTGQVNRILKAKERKGNKVCLEKFTEEDDLSAIEELRYLQLNANDALSKRLLAGRSPGDDFTVMRAETDTSIKINSLAAKYLQLAPQGSRPSRRHRPVGNFRSGTNMSIATMQYLQRYQLITDAVPAVREKPVRARRVRHREPVPSRILDVTAIKNLPKLLPKKKP